MLTTHSNPTAAAGQTNDQFHTMIHSEAHQTILKIFRGMKEDVLRLSAAGQGEACMQRFVDVLMFMNRFRNCDLRVYFDLDMQDAVKALNPKRFNCDKRLKPKKEYRIAFILNGMSDLGGASIPHRYMLKRYADANVSFRQYVLHSNMSNRAGYEHTEVFRYLRDEVELEKFEELPLNMAWLEKGRRIEQWLYDNEIDFVVGEPCPAVIYALASRPALIHAILSQDTYTYTLGPGAADITFLFTIDQYFKYEWRGHAPELSTNLVLLPLHDASYAHAAEPLSRAELGVPEDAIVSGTTNIWKCCFGDSETLLSGIAALIRRHPNYHHVFAGTPRCLDNIDVFLAHNADICSNIHFAGAVKNIYRLLKTIDFWVNSFPTSGGSDIEAAFVGKPSIEFVGNRNLDLHPVEFLNSRECNVVSLDEFVALGDRFITDPVYRKDLGAYLQQRVSREYNKESLVKGRIYDFFVRRYNKLLKDVDVFPAIQLDDTLEYEKRIGVYAAYGRAKWSLVERRSFLDGCRRDFPKRPFAWIKSIEEAITSGDVAWFFSLAKELSPALLNDHRVRVLMAIAFDHFARPDEALEHARRAVSLAKFDQVPARVAARLLLKHGDRDAAIAQCENLSALRGKLDEGCDVHALLKTLPPDTMPLYYNY